jgi:hypothetical protein
LILSTENRLSLYATLFLFVKGTAETEIEKLVADAQIAASIETLEKIKTLSQVGEIIVSTASEEFAEQARALGATVEIDPPDTSFHWGRQLAMLVEKHRASTPLYIGGGSGALMSAADWQNMVQRALDETNIVITNNYFSCDFAAWSPGDALKLIDPPELDNDLAFRLGERIGLKRVSLPKNAATQLDIDTPSDLQTISFHPALGNKLRAVIDAAHLDTSHVEHLLPILTDRDQTMLAVGRVSASMMLFLERETRCQWRVFSEERGMRASGREARGEVRSLVGFYLEQAGIRNFAQALPQLANAALVDSRIIFAHYRLLPNGADRFHSDLLQPEAIHDSFLREFTAAMRDARIPILLGGHSLVSGGMYALVEVIKARAST